LSDKVILQGKAFELTLQRLCRELVENHGDFSNTAILGLQPRGVRLANRLVEMLKKIESLENLKYGKLDISFHRDDFRRRDEIIIPSVTQIDFLIEGMNVILVDDVLFTGRTIRAGLDAMLTFGRPKSVELLVFYERRFSRELPVQPNYVGRQVDALTEQKLKVEWEEYEGKDQVILYTPDK
jgi:pyrimidine operon attenuation protein/uracil phosphoribosyltransferase